VASTNEADLALRQAVTAAAEAYGLLEPGEAIGDLAIVAYVYPGDDSDDDGSRYISLFGQPTIPSHVARGLWMSAVAMMDE